MAFDVIWLEQMGLLNGSTVWKMKENANSTEVVRLILSSRQQTTRRKDSSRSKFCITTELGDAIPQWLQELLIDDQCIGGAVLYELHIQNRAHRI